MATKSKLEQAIKSQAESLSPAQRELVLAQFSNYKDNASRISQIKSQLDTVCSMQTATLDEVRYKQAQRTTLSYELNQLTIANSKITAELFEFLKE